MSKQQEAALRNRRLARSIATVLAFEGFTMSINGIGSPWIAKSFHLGEAGIAGLFAWISLSAIGALGLSRMIDRLGRRRMLLVCMAGTAVSANTVVADLFSQSNQCVRPQPVFPGADEGIRAL